jgi:two-component system, LytTR family, sensor kinase
MSPRGQHVLYVIAKALLLWLAITLVLFIFLASFRWMAVLGEALDAALCTVGFYVAYHILVKHFLYRKKRALFIAGYLLLLCVLSMANMFTDYWLYQQEGKAMAFFLQHYWSDPVFYTSHFSQLLFVITTLLGIRFFSDHMRTRVKLENLEKEKISAELEFLKAQINPHFLFNSINTVFFQIDKSNQPARETLQKFSELLRYQLYECGADRVEIEKEIHYIQNYIAIQMLRKTEMYDCTFSVSPQVKGFTIAPLLLIPFVENAFKYVSNDTNRKNRISVVMNYQDGNFYFTIENDTDHKPAAIRENQGIGLSNIQRRLNLVYPNKHELEIKRTEHTFLVSMKIKVT